MLSGRKRIARVAVGVIATGIVIAASAGVAEAVSGGGYSPDQSNCAWNGYAWNTPPTGGAPGCHSFAVNVEQGGTTNGDPNSGNTRYAGWGSNQLPTGGPSGTPDIFSIGYPGNTNSPHAGCAGANTAGLASSDPNCAGNSGGTGASFAYDYYNVIQPTWTPTYVPGLCDALLALGQNVGFVGTGDPNCVPVPGAPNVVGNSPITNLNTSTTPPDPNATAQNFITNGVGVYIGADDNLDAGEHDGFSGANNTDGAINGPSDGGAIWTYLQPSNLLVTAIANYLQGNANAPGSPSQTDPVSGVGTGLGLCADGICTETTTHRQSIYQGCGATNPSNNSANDQCVAGTPSSTDAFRNDTPASTKESSNCSSGGPASSETACYTNSDGSSNPNGANGYRSNTPSNVYAEPGIQTYQDPDPQRSPATPFATPGIYAGTCGAYVNDQGGWGQPGVVGLATGGNVTPPPVDATQC